MPIFQKSVVKKHLENLDSTHVEQAYQKFLSNYNTAKIEEIKTLKEEEYQDGFLRDLFVDVLGYTLRPDENYNLHREFKNQSDGKKADGAIIKDGNAIAVIELKSTKTKDLKSVTQQAFNYKNNQPECKYVVTSNFQKLRFYIDYANEYEEFDLFQLSPERFKLLYLILSKESVFTNLPLQLKEETKFHDQKISDDLYKDYSRFKRTLYENLTKNHPNSDKLTLFKKSQKLLDRFLFILFAEDSGLLPPNSISEVIKRFEVLKENDAYKPIYEIFKQYFGYMNIGRKGKTAAGDIPAYNGGLFYADQELDNFKIDDKILIDDLLNLSEYDFNTEVDVNILGHIFEHSLNEIEEITAQIEGTAPDKTKSKRKKDGVFYTPKYITQYIVENTVGTLCTEKRIELGIDEIEFDNTYRTKAGKLSEKGKKLFKKLTSYKDWLTTLKIIDPACGSGAFLNQALNFLIEEHATIDDVIADLTNSPLRLFDVDKSILENNLFGVDINEESVEIAKLSLWLRTAQKGRKLSSLNNNIKCGNSLIDDPEIAGDKAFNWNTEFKDIMDNGGFDCVIGNPPYIRVQGLKANYNKESQFYEQNYQAASGKYDIYALFMEMSFKLLNQKGKLSFILPHKFLIADFGSGIRRFFGDNKAVERIVHFGSEIVFKDASTYTCIINLSHENSTLKFQHQKPSEIFNKFEFEEIHYDSLGVEKWNLTNGNVTKVINKLRAQPLTVKDVFENVFRGIVTGSDDIFMLRGRIHNGIFHGFSVELKQEVQLEESIVKQMLKGQDIKRYETLYSNLYILYPHKKDELNNTKPYEEKELMDKFPLTYSYLLNFKEKLVAKKIKYKTNPLFWYSLHNSREISNFEREKIFTAYLTYGSQMTMDKYGAFYSNDKCSGMIKKDAFREDYEFYLTILNSSLMWFFIKNTSSEYRGGFYVYSNSYINPFPLPKLKNLHHQQPFIEKANQMMAFNQQLQQKSTRFIKRLYDNLELQKTTKKLDTFYNHDFKVFVGELKKQKIKLTLTQQDEWEEYFNTYKTEINQIQNQIATTDAEIDSMVYGLYGLSEEEISIVEESSK